MRYLTLLKTSLVPDSLDSLAANVESSSIVEDAKRGLVRGGLSWNFNERVILMGASPRKTTCNRFPNEIHELSFRQVFEIPIATAFTRRKINVDFDAEIKMHLQCTLKSLFIF